MASQYYDWTCSVCSITWVLQASNSAYSGLNVSDARYDVGMRMGYPSCVNSTYGCMSTGCVLATFNSYGLDAISSYVTFDQAYAICRERTGTINPNGMYHFMGIRGVDGGDIWVANSAPGYRGIWDTISREQFNALGPVELVSVYL
jgi:hypothetical protein